MAAVCFATIATVFTNVFLTHVPSPAGSSDSILAWSMWANAPLNLSLSLSVLGLYALEPRKSTIRMLTLQQIATGLLIVVTVCVVYTACNTLRGGAIGVGAARLQRACELNIGGLMFMYSSVLLCDTITVSQSAVVAALWGCGWLISLNGIASWATRACVWTIAQSLSLIVCKWLLEAKRRRRWLHMLRLEGELRTLGEFSLGGTGQVSMDESSDGGSKNGSRKFKCVGSLDDDDPVRDRYYSTPSIVSWLFGEKSDWSSPTL